MASEPSIDPPGEEHCRECFYGLEEDGEVICDDSCDPAEHRLCREHRREARELHREDAHEWD